MSTQSVEAAFKAIDAYRNQTARFGVWDSEPHYKIRKLVEKSVQGEQVKVPTTPRGWEIYNMTGADEVAINLHQHVSNLISEISNTTVFEANTPQFKYLIAVNT